MNVKIYSKDIFEIKEITHVDRSGERQTDKR